MRRQQRRKPPAESVQEDGSCSDGAVGESRDARLHVGAGEVGDVHVQEDPDQTEQPQVLRESLVEARTLRRKLQTLLKYDSSRKGSELSPTKYRDAQKFWRLSLGRRASERPAVFVFDAATTNAGWTHDTAKRSVGSDAPPILRAVDHRKRWLVRPTGDLERGLAHVHPEDQQTKSGGSKQQAVTKSAPAPWIGAMETLRMSRSHRDHALPTAPGHWADGHNHSKFEACHETCPGRIFVRPWQLVSRGSWHIISHNIEPPHSTANVRTGNVQEYSTKVYREFVDLSQSWGKEAVFGIDSMWNGVVDGLLEWHAQEARDRRGTKQQATLRRLRYALKERGFENPVEAFIFFDIKGKGALSSLEVSAGLKKLQLEERFRPAEKLLTKEQASKFLALLGVDQSIVPKPVTVGTGEYRHRKIIKSAVAAVIEGLLCAVEQTFEAETADQTSVRRGKGKYVSRNGRTQPSEEVIEAIERTGYSSPCFENEVETESTSGITVTLPPKQEKVTTETNAQVDGVNLQSEEQLMTMDGEPGGDGLAAQSNRIRRSTGPLMHRVHRRINPVAVDDQANITSRRTAPRRANVNASMRRIEIEAIYEKHCAERLPDVDRLVARYGESKLLKFVRQKYGTVSVQRPKTANDVSKQVPSQLEICVQIAPDRTLKLDCDALTLVGTIKDKVEAMEGIPREHQQLTVMHRKLHDAQTLDTCGIGSGSTVLLNRRRLTRAEQHKAKQLLLANDLILKREADRLVQHVDYLRKRYASQPRDAINIAPLSELAAVRGSSLSFNVQQDRYRVFPDGHSMQGGRVAAQLELRIARCSLSTDGKRLIEPVRLNRACEVGLCFIHDDGATLIDVLPFSRLAGWEVRGNGSALQIALKTLYVQVSTDRAVAMEYDEAMLVANILKGACEKERLSPERYQLVFRRHVLKNHQTLLRCGIESDMTLQLTEVSAGVAEQIAAAGLVQDNAHYTPVLVVLRTNEARELATTMLTVAKEVFVGDLPFGHINTRVSSEEGSASAAEQVTGSATLGRSLAAEDDSQAAVSMPENLQKALIRVLWEGVHAGRSLFGTTCYDIPSFFRAAGRSNGGYLSCSELREAFARLDVGLTAAQLDGLLVSLDTDRDGKVSLPELESWMSVSWTKADSRKTGVRVKAERADLAAAHFGTDSSSSTGQSQVAYSNHPVARLSSRTKPQRERLHDFLADSTLDDIEAWWLGTDEQLDVELRRPVGVAASIARVRAMFAACAQHHPGEIEEIFPSSCSNDTVGTSAVTLGTWMRMMAGAQFFFLYSFSWPGIFLLADSVTSLLYACGLPSVRSGWGSLLQASVKEQNDAYVKAQSTRETVAQRVLNISRSGNDTDNANKRHHRPSLAQREAARVEAAWLGWQRVGEKLWMHRGVPFAARLALASARGMVQNNDDNTDGDSIDRKQSSPTGTDLPGQGGWQFDAGLGWSYDGDTPKQERVQNIRDKGAAITRGWAELSNAEREAAELLGWTTASWIARDATPLAVLRLQGQTLTSAQRLRHIDKEQKRLLSMLGFRADHEFGIYYADADVPSSLHEMQVFVTVKHSDTHVSEPIVPQFEAIVGMESTCATRPLLHDSRPRRSGAVWQQSYAPSTLRPEDPPRAALLRGGGRAEPI